MEKITVVMPVRNAGKTLARAMDSLFYQTHDNLEVVAVNDQSTDNSLEILKRYERKDGFKLVIVNWEGPRPEHNVSGALNLGLKTALFTSAWSGYIARMDADDESDPKRLANQLAWMKHHDLQLTGTWAHVLDEDNYLIEDFHPWVTTQNAREWLTKFNYFIHGSVMFDAKVFSEVGLYSTDHTYIQDYELWLRIANAFRVGVVPEYLYYLNRGPSSTTGKENLIYNQAKNLREAWAKTWGITIPEEDLPNFRTVYQKERGRLS